MCASPSRGAGSDAASAGSLGVIVAIALALAFGWSTDFIGDDHLFLAWSRYASSPFEAFVRDVHGGEYDRPLPLCVWWCLGRLGQGGRWPFAIFMAAGHATAGWLLMRLLRSRGESRAVAGGAAALFLMAPAQVDAMSWYAASTDLLACLGLLASLEAAQRWAAWWFLLPATAAILSKESAVVLPLALVVVLPWRAHTSTRQGGPLLRVRRVLARAPLRAGLGAAGLVAVLLVRRMWLFGGWGGAGDPLPAFSSRVLLLVLAGLARLSGLPPTVDPVIAALAGAVTALLLFVTAKSGRPATPEQAGGSAHAPSPLSSEQGPAPAWVPWALFGVLMLPLLTVSEGLATRYTYAPTLALSWGVARVVFGGRGSLVAASSGQGPRHLRPSVSGSLILLGLLTGSSLQIRERARDIRRYRAVLSAARSAVAAGVARGGRLFHVAAGIKDLDLAVKEAPALAPLRHEFWVLSDVPASFVFEPPLPLRPLLASPPLPPSGAYRFGGERIVGLARRGDEPSLDEAFARWPDLRLLRPCSARAAAGAAAAAFCDETDRFRPTHD